MDLTLVKNTKLLYYRPNSSTNKLLTYTQVIREVKETTSMWHPINISFVVLEDNSLVLYFENTHGQAIPMKTYLPYRI